MALVILGAGLSTLAVAWYMPATAIGILLAFAFADLLLYVLMKDVLVCYRCQATYRDASGTGDCQRFRLETAERYRQEAARVGQARASAGIGPP